MILPYWEVDYDIINELAAPKGSYVERVEQNKGRL